MASPPIEYAFVGTLTEDYSLTLSGEARLHEMGGSALYAAVGAHLWSPAIGLVARVGENYSSDWLKTLAAKGFDLQGVPIIPGAPDLRNFYAYLSADERVETDPAAHFARVGQSLPPELADYTPNPVPESHTQFSPLAARPSDVPESYLHIEGFHLAPSEFAVHHTFPATLRRYDVHYVTCDPGSRYMQPAFAEDVKLIVHRLDAFLPSESETRAFFRDQIEDLWQAAEAFGAMGAKIVVIKLGARGQYVYETDSKRKWHVPAYPAKVRDLTGAGDAYCGGFLVGLAQTHDPVEAARRGAVSASFVIEGNSALYALQSMPGLVTARLESLRDSVRQI